MSQQPLNQLSPEAQEERKRLRREAALGLGTLEELEMFSRLFLEPSWQLLQRYLSKWEAGVDKEMWGSRELSVEKVHFLKGQMQAVRSMLRLPEEIKASQEALKTASESE